MASAREQWRMIQRAAGTTVDGVPGPKTAAALVRHLDLDDDDPVALRWPREHYAAMTRFYGEPGAAQLVKAEVPFEMQLAWDASKKLREFSVHKKCKAAVEGIFAEALEVYGLADIRKLRLDRFGGCYNLRKKRGGTSWSVHAWGAAIDLDPTNNALRWNHTRAAFAKEVYGPFWEIVERYGGVSLGRERDFDWMHFQFARL